MITRRKLHRLVFCAAGIYNLDKSGKSVISGNFRYASSFSSGLARIETMSKDGLLEGYVDRTGKIVWRPTK